jgi:hypothetical protein
VDGAKPHPYHHHSIPVVGGCHFYFIILQLIRRFLKKKLPDSTTRYKSQKGLEIIGYVFVIFFSISYFTGNIAEFTIAIGILSAGVAITLQELIWSIAGSLYIFFVKVY